MYNEIEIINKITDKQSKVRIISLFIEEYGGWLQHLNAVGCSWGACGEETWANAEAVKTRKHIDDLNDILIKNVN